MNRNAEILAILIEEDFGLRIGGSSNYIRSSKHDSLVIDKERGIFFWNSESIVGDPLIYLTKVRHYSFESAKDFLRNFGYTGTHVYTVQANGEDVVVYPELVDTFYNLGIDRRDYFYKRGLTDATIDRFQLGWYNDFNIIPFFQDGVFRNFQMRKDNPKTIRKYYRGVGPLLFNSDILKIVNEVYFVEGPVDAMILIQNGLPAISTDMSGNVLPQWYVKFVKQNRIYVVMDNDDAGKKEAQRVSKILGITRCPIYTFSDFEESGYDPVDYFRDGGTAKDFEALVKNKSKFMFELH